MQIGKFELLHWASPQTHDLQRWPDILPHLYIKLNALFHTTFTPLSTSFDFSVFFSSISVPNFIDWEAVDSGKGRAVFNFLAFLYVLESVKEGSSTPIEFALPVDSRISEFLESEDAARIVNLPESIVKIVDNVSQKVSNSGKKFDSSDVKLENFLTQMDSLVPNLDESVCLKSMIASKVLQKAVEGDTEKELFDAEIQTEINAGDLSNEIMKVQSKQNNSIYKELLEEVVILRNQNESYKSLIESYRNQINSQTGSNDSMSNLLFGLIQDVKKTQNQLLQISEGQIQVKSDIKTQQMLFNTIKEIQQQVNDDKLNMYQQYEILLKKDIIEKGVVQESQEILNMFGQLDIQLNGFNDNINESLTQLAQYQELNVKESQQIIEHLKSENGLIQQQMVNYQKQNEELKRLNSQLIENTDQDMMKDVQALLQKCSGVELTASLIQLTEKFQFYINKFQFIQDSYNKKLKTLNFINFESSDIQLIQQDLDDEPEVIFQSYNLLFSDKLKQLLTQIGIHTEYFTSSPISVQNLPLNQTINIIKQIESDGILLSEESLQLQASNQKIQIEQLILVISSILKQFSQYSLQINEKHANIVKICRNLQIQAVNSTEEISKQFAQKLTEKATSQNIAQDEIEFYKSKVHSQQQQINQLIQNNSVSEQAQLEAKRLWQRVKQLTQCLDLFQDVTDQLLSNNTFNVKQKLLDINSLKNQPVQYIEKSVFQSENLLQIERKRADDERIKGKETRDQVAGLKGEILVLEEMLQMVKLDCKQSIQICLQEE